MAPTALGTSAVVLGVAAVLVATLERARGRVAAGAGGIAAVLALLSVLS